MAAVQQVAYKELQVWQKGMEFANQVIQLIEGLDTPRKHFRLLEQLESAVPSVPIRLIDSTGLSPGWQKGE